MPHRAVDFEVVRTLGEALPEVTITSGKRGTALKIGRRLLACKAIHKSAEPDSLMVRISLNRRAVLLTQNAKAYYVTDHYAPYPAMLVRLAKINRASLNELLAESWEFVRAEVR